MPLLPTPWSAGALKLIIVCAEEICRITPKPMPGFISPCLEERMRRKESVAAEAYLLSGPVGQIPLSQ